MKQNRIERQDPKYIYSDAHKANEIYWEKVWAEIERQRQVLRDIMDLMNTTDDEFDEKMLRYDK
jgi:hypothetical protein